MSADDNHGDGPDEGFSYVTVQKKSNRRKRKGKTEALSKEEKLTRSSAIVEEKRKCLHDGKYGDELSDCLSRLIDSLPETHRKTKRIVCLGLGPVRESRAAQLQLAFLLRLRAMLSEACSVAAERIPTVAFDPIFDEDDWTILEHYGVSSCEGVPEDTRLAAGEPTMFFMPHCERNLYERLWSVNKSRGTLDQALLVGNDPQLYALNATDARFAAEAPTLASLLPRIRSHRIPDAPKPMTDAFNSQTFQWIGSDASRNDACAGADLLPVQDE